MAPIIVLSALGYGSLLTFDLPVTRKQPLIRVLLGMAMTLLLATAFVLGLQGEDSLVWSVWSRALGLALLVVGGLLAAYSALLEIPMRLARNRTKATANVPPDSKAVIQVGTYALCRHPGFLWMLFYLTGLVLFVSRISTLELALSWAVLDFVVVYIQDRAIFPRTFPAYSRYQAATPFVIPTLASLRVAIRSFVEPTDEHLSTENE